MSAQEQHDAQDDEARESHSSSDHRNEIPEGHSSAIILRSSTSSKSGARALFGEREGFLTAWSGLYPGTCESVLAEGLDRERLPQTPRATPSLAPPHRNVTSREW